MHINIRSLVISIIIEMHRNRGMETYRTYDLEFVAIGSIYVIYDIGKMAIVEERLDYGYHSR